MTIAELLNQQMPGDSVWENFIYLLDNEILKVDSIFKVQTLLRQITGTQRTASLNYVHDRFKRNFTG